MICLVSVETEHLQAVFVNPVDVDIATVTVNSEVEQFDSVTDSQVLAIAGGLSEGGLNLRKWFITLRLLT